MFRNWTWVKTLQFLNLCIKKNLSMLGVISHIPVLEKHRLLILKKCKWRKLYFMKVILLYLVLEKLVFRAFQNVGSTTVFFY